MSKRKLTRQQAWRIEKIQKERLDRASRHKMHVEDLLESGGLGQEQVGRIVARFGKQVEVVAVDDNDATIELQFFDGTIDEVDRETWSKLLIERVAPPEDWSGSVDMDPEDYSGREDGEYPVGYHDPLAFLDKVD